MAAVKNSLDAHPDPFLWRQLAELTLSRLLVFNARRGSEGAELTSEEFLKLTSEIDPSLASTFSAAERQLLNRLSILIMISVVADVCQIYLFADYLIKNSCHLEQKKR